MSDRPERLYLIDGNSLVYRAFFALPESIATSTGQPTNAIFGFASMLVKLLTEHGVQPTIVVWDAGLSGRKEISQEYKAQRASRPDLLREQWPHFAPLVEAFGYRNVSVEGYEADDVIASIAERAREQAIKSTIVTGDRDAFQLIDPDGVVTVMATSRGITETKLYDHQAVIDRYGIAPELIPDFYGLKGDTSDNIPGVPGIGDKTAAQLLQAWGDLEGVLSHIDEISGAKRKENLTNHADDARLSKQLATIQRDVPVDIDVGQELGREPDRSRLREVFREFELRDPLRRLEDVFGEDGAAPGGLGAEASQALRAAVREGTATDAAALPGDELAVAVTEPTIEEGQLLALEERWRFAVASGDRVVVGHVDTPEQLVDALGDRPITAHDVKALRRVPPRIAHDTLLGAYLLEPARRGYPFGELCSERGIAADTGDALADTAVLTAALTGWQREQLDERDLGGLLRDMELPLVSVLRDMELAGVRLNVARLNEVGARVRDEIGALEREIWDLAGEEFLIASPQQLGSVLFEKLGLSRKRRGKTGFSTDARVLQAIRDEHAIIPKIERWRELNQLAKTYLDTLPALTDEHSRIHTTFEQAVAQTGRLSSKDPNMQNVPVRTALGREIRGCFEAADGNVLLSIDYSQIELRVLAHIADEPVLKEIFVRGEDVHSATAAQVFAVAPDQIDTGQRSKAKMVNYGIVYGLTDFGMADRLGIERDEAKEFIDAYFARFPAVKAYIDTTIEQAREHGFVMTMWGRRRQIPELKARNWQVRSLGERLAVNTPIQGTAADILKLAMIRTARLLAGSEVRPILTVHDELLFEGPPAAIADAQPGIVAEMVGVWEHTPPLEVDAGVGKTWLEAK